MQTPLTEEQSIDYEVFERFLFTGSRRDDQTHASTAIRNLMRSLGRENGALIVSARIHQNAIERMEGSSQSYPSLGWLNKGYHGVKQTFLAALYKRMVRKLVLRPLCEFMHKISDPWAYPRAALIAGDIEGLQADYGGVGFGFDALSPEMEARLSRYKHLLTKDKIFSDKLIKTVLDGDDIFELNHPAINAPPDARPRRNRNQQEIDVDADDDDNDGEEESPPVTRKRSRKSSKPKPQKKNPPKKSSKSRPSRKAAKPSYVEEEDDDDDEYLDMLEKIEDHIDSIVEELDDYDDEDERFVVPDDEYDEEDDHY